MEKFGIEPGGLNPLGRLVTVEKLDDSYLNPLVRDGLQMTFDLQIRSLPPRRIVLAIVVFPEAEVPTIATKQPQRITRSTLSSAGRSVRG